MCLPPLQCEAYFLCYHASFGETRVHLYTLYILHVQLHIHALHIRASSFQVYSCPLMPHTLTCYAFDMYILCADTLHNRTSISLFRQTPIPLCSRELFELAIHTLFFQFCTSAVLSVCCCAICGSVAICSASPHGTFVLHVTTVLHGRSYFSYTIAIHGACYMWLPFYTVRLIYIARLSYTLRTGHTSRHNRIWTTHSLCDHLSIHTSLLHGAALSMCSALAI